MRNSHELVFEKCVKIIIDPKRDEKKSDADETPTDEMQLTIYIYMIYLYVLYMTCHRIISSMEWNEEGNSDDCTYIEIEGKVFV